METNENTEGGGCDDWTSWSGFMHLGPDVYFIKWFFYVLWAVSILLSDHTMCKLI
jgi:chloride channel 3/4/5